MAIEVPQNEEISGGGKERRNRFCHPLERRKYACIHIEKREQGGVVKRDVDLYIIRVGIERRKRECGKFRKG